MSILKWKKGNADEGVVREVLTADLNGKKLFVEYLPQDCLATIVDEDLFGSFTAKNCDDAINQIEAHIIKKLQHTLSQTRIALEIMEPAEDDPLDPCQLMQFKESLGGDSVESFNQLMGYMSLTPGKFRAAVELHAPEVLLTEAFLLWKHFWQTRGATDFQC